MEESETCMRESGVYFGELTYLPEEFEEFPQEFKKFLKESERFP